MRNTQTHSVSNMSNSKCLKPTLVNLSYLCRSDHTYVIFILDAKRLDTIADDSATNISRNRVSFNVCESDKQDQSGSSKLSSIISKNMLKASSSKVMNSI